MTTKIGEQRDPELLEMPERTFLMVDGRGDPNGSEDFQRAIEALYSLSYGLKFLLKRRARGRSHGRAARGALVGRRGDLSRSRTAPTGGGRS